MSDSQKVLDMIKEHDVQYVDLRFTDPRGKWQHTAQHVSTVNDDFFEILDFRGPRKRFNAVRIDFCLNLPQ